MIVFAVQGLQLWCVENPLSNSIERLEKKVSIYIVDTFLKCHVELSSLWS